MLRSVILHGRLGKKFGRRFKLAVNSPAEAVRALANQLPGFSAYIRERNYTVTVGDGTRISADLLNLNLGDPRREIHITPAGAVAGIETILLGAVLLFTAVASIGVLLMPKAPAASSREDATKTASFIFDGPQNVTEQGHPVPLVYGQFRTGSAIVSAGITTSDFNAASVSADPTNPSYVAGSNGLALDGGTNYSGYVGSSPGIVNSKNGEIWLSKGGGKSGSSSTRAAQEDPNTLQSAATAKIVDVVSEGEIVGLVNGLQSVFFDNTPVQNSDGSFNFAGVSVEQRVGLPDQDFVPGFSQTEQTTSVNAKISIQTGPITRTISDPDVTVARVTIKLPQLYQQDTTNGDLKASSVTVRVSVQADGGGFSTVSDMVFSGKTNSEYQRSLDVRLPNGNSRDIRVTRITADSTLASLQNETYFDLLTEVVEAKLSYPDTALYALTVDARQFGSSIPTRSYEIKGIIIEVPSNYDPIARTYTGIWDGTFKRAWSNNPAWVMRDLLVNRRYGLGARIPSTAIDIWSLYAIAQYCDGLVPDGNGGMQPRFTINVAITNPAQAYDLLASIASTFRGWVFWGSGTIVTIQDRPEDPSILITPANVIDGSINYGRITPAEKRRSAAVVYWNDPSDSYRLTPEVYEDPALIRRFGRRSGDDVTGYGITNKAQAHRAARWVLEDEAPASNGTAAYSVGDDHAFTEPGRIAAVADPMFTQNRRGGRVRAATGNAVLLDAPYSFATGQNYYLRVMLPDGTTMRRAVTSTGTTDQVNLAGAAYPTPPIAGAVWAIETDTVANRQFRIRRIATSEPPYAVEAVLHDPVKYARVEQNLTIASPNYLDLPTGPLATPSNIAAFEFLLPDGNATIPAVQVSWQIAADPRVTFFQSQFLRPGGNWEALDDSLDLSRVIRGTAAGTWTFRVRSIDSLGNKTGWAEAAVYLDGQVEYLPEVLGLTVQTSNQALQSTLVWQTPADTRPLRAQVLFAADATFAHAIILATVDTQEYAVPQIGRYWVRTLFIDSVSGSPPFVDVTVAQLPKPGWSAIANDNGNLPADKATNSADPASPFGTSTVGGTLTTISAAQSDIAAAKSQLASIQAAIDAGDSATVQAARQARDAAITAQNAAVDAKNLASSYAANANGFASSASGSASTAASQASAAAASASSASGYANTALVQAGAASYYASAANSSAAAANTSAAAAQQYSSLAASVGGGYLNANSNFTAWAGVTPDSWNGWDYTGGAPNKIAGVNGRPYALNFQAAANVNDGVIEYISHGFGKFVFGCTVESDSYQGAGLRCDWVKGSTGQYYGASQIDFANQPDNSGWQSAGDGGRYRRTFTQYFETAIDGGIDQFRLYCMANWEALGTRAAKNITFHEAWLRPANDSEIKAQRADANASTALAQITYQAGVAASANAATASFAQQLQSQVNGLSATVSQQGGTIATIDGKTQAYFSITAQAGGNLASVSVYATNGQGGMASGVILGGNVYIDGNLTIAGTIHTGAAAVNAFAANYFSINSNTYSGQGTGSGGHYEYDPDTGERVYVNDGVTPQTLCSITVTLPYKADVVVSFAAAASFSSGNRAWSYVVRQNGNVVTQRGGTAPNDTPNGRALKPGLAAGTYTYDLTWVGQDGNVSTFDINLLVEVGLNYGNAAS